MSGEKYVDDTGSGNRENHVRGIVYILTNPAMPNLVKIGCTTEGKEAERLDQLYTTGVPAPFRCELALRLEEAHTVERTLYKKFAKERYNTSREFFEIDADAACKVLRKYDGTDVTTTVNMHNARLDHNSQSILSVSPGRRADRRPTQNFLEMGLQIGDQIVHHRTGEVAEVIDGRTIRYHGRNMGLNEAARLAEGENKRVTRKVWTYKGEYLTDIYYRTYPTAG